MSFPLWSEISKEAQKTLKPDFGIRSWDTLTEEEKDLIWKHLEQYLFDKDIRQDEFYNPDPEDAGYYYEFYDDDSNIKSKAVLQSIHDLNIRYKANVYAKTYFKYKGLLNACMDFYLIFSKENEHVVLELLSLYCKSIIEESERIEKIHPKNEQETKKAYLARIEKAKWSYFDEFSKLLNEVFLSFGLNVILTRAGFTPRQDERIIKEIYEPVLKILSKAEWTEVNTLLANAYTEYMKNTPEGYSACVTYAVTSVQAFLQLLVYGKTGSGDISKLIPQAQAKKLIPSDLLTTGLFRNIESILMTERNKTGIAHPPKEYATDKNARLVLNLTMVFIQHCLTS